MLLQVSYLIVDQAESESDETLDPFPMNEIPKLPEYSENVDLRPPRGSRSKTQSAPVFELSQKNSLASSFGARRHTVKAEIEIIP